MKGRVRSNVNTLIVFYVFLIQKSGIVFAKGPNGRGGIHGSLHADPEGFRTGFTIALTAQKSAQ